MKLKLFNNIRLSSTAESNKVLIFNYECPVCYTKDYYLCLDPGGIVLCFNCGETLYVREMLECTDPDLCKKIIELEIGTIREAAENAEFTAELEKGLLKDLKQKYED